jgi:plasmid stabilization system protein ParE
MNAERGFELHPGAASDITSIWEFIAKDTPLAAKRVREDILDAIRRLVPYPSRPPMQRSHLTMNAKHLEKYCRLKARPYQERRTYNQKPCFLREGDGK